MCRLRDRTYSVWAHISKYVTDFTNPFYKKDHELSQSIVIPVTNSQSFKLVCCVDLSFDVLAVASYHSDLMIVASGL